MWVWGGGGKVFQPGVLSPIALEVNSKLCPNLRLLFKFAGIEIGGEARV